MHGLTHRKFNTVFDNSYLSQLLCTKETIRLNEDYWGQNLEKERVSKNFLLDEISIVCTPGYDYLFRTFFTPSTPSC